MTQRSQSWRSFGKSILTRNIKRMYLLASMRSGRNIRPQNQSSRRCKKTTPRSRAFCGSAEIFETKTPDFAASDCRRRLKSSTPNILQDLPANWDPLQAAAVLAPALKAYPDANVLAIASDVMMSGVQKVLQDANKWRPFPDPNHMYFIRA